MSGVQSDEALYGLLVRAGQAREVPAGEVLFERGQAGDSMFVLSSGSVSLSNGERMLERLEAPGLFGEMALIESAPRALTATVADDAELVEIPVRTFWVLVHETPCFAALVMRVMAERLRQASGT